MRSAYPLLLSVIFISFSGCNRKSQKSRVTYTDYERGRDFYWNLPPNYDSAFFMFNRYVNNPDDTLKKGSAYNYMADILWKIGDLYGAQESLTGALRTLDTLNKEHYEELGYTYNLSGNVSLDLKLYPEAINFYNKAKSIYKKPSFVLEVLNGKATAFKQGKNYNEAIAMYDSILALQPADRLLLARATDNRAITEWLSDSSYPALPELRAALKIRVDSQDNWGLNASYAHLSDYYVKSNSDSALWYAQKMRETAKENQSPGDILEAIDKLIRLNNSPALKEKWYEKHENLRDSLQFSRDTTKKRFADIKYDYQKSKADNLALQQHITRQRLLMYGLAALALIIITVLWIWYDKRRKRIKQESENTIRESRLKTSRKIHDVVANGLYGIMNELEHGNAIEKEPLMTRIEGLYEKSRDISYEDIPAVDSADYNNRIHDLLTSFASEQTKVIIVGNQQTFWSRISLSQKHELQLILNEIMINMKKHSHAKNAVVVFKQEEGKGFITYKDDGIGFSPGLRFGNGLNNTVNRIKSLHGEINFGKSEKEGALITISFPLESDKT